MILNWELREVLPEFRPEGRLNMLITLILHANARLRCWPSVDRLADETDFGTEAVSAAKKWLLDRGAMVLVPFGQRVGAEKKLPVRQHVYQLTGVIADATGKFVRYLYLTPEAEADLRATLKGFDIPLAGTLLPEVSTAKVSPSEVSAVEREGVSTSKGVSTLSRIGAFAPVGEGDSDEPLTGQAAEEEEAELDRAHSAPEPDEPRYVSDPFEEEGQQRPKWALPDVKDVLLMRALAATKRKYFQKGERTLWKQVRQAILARRMSEDWVISCTAYAEKKKAMPFPNLVKWILNPDKMVDWEQRRLGGTVRTYNGVSLSSED